MSDGARKRQRLKLSAPSKNGTPHGSRSGSPDAPGTKAVQIGAGAGSRAGSPGKFYTFFFCFYLSPRIGAISRQKLHCTLVRSHCESSLALR